MSAALEAPALEARARAALPGWRAEVTAASTGGCIATLISPDFDRDAATGRLIVVCGRDAPSALIAALEKARGCLDPLHHRRD